MTDDYNVRNAMIGLIDNIKFKVDCDEELRRRMAFTWEHLQDVDRFNLFMVGLMVMGIVREWKGERVE
jgi:hypothetical protein